MTATEIVKRKLTAALQTVRVLEELLVDLVALEAPGQPNETVPAPEPVKATAPRAKAPAKTAARQAGRAARANLPPVLTALAAEPMTTSELVRATGQGKMKLVTVLQTFGPGANGTALFARDDLKKWSLTELGRREATKGE